MPQSKKDLRAQKQRQNMKAGIGDEKGRLPANQKVLYQDLTQNMRLIDPLNTFCLMLLSYRQKM